MARNDAGYPFMRSLLICLKVGAGFCIAIQGAVNSRLRLAVDSPVLSLAISFLSGGLICIEVRL